METAEIVKIAVSAAPYSIDKPYDYLVPPELLETAVPGVRVTVPFGRGNRTSEGIILARTPGEKMQGLKTCCRSWTEGRYWTAMASPWHCGCGSGTSARCLKR